MVNRILQRDEQWNIMSRISYLTLEMVVFCILLGTLAIVEAQESNSAQSVKDINSFIPMVEAAEERPFLNLRVDSEKWVETRASLSEPWQRTPMYVSCTAWFGAEGKARIDVHKQILKWIDGAAPYGESSYSVSFDGHYGRVAYHTTGHSDKTHHTKEGKLLSGVPEQLTNHFLDNSTGAQFTTYFFFDVDDRNKGRSFSRLFRAAISPSALKDKAFEVALEEFQGVECIKFGSSPAEWGRETWWFDPNRGFALIAYMHTSKVDDVEHVVSDIRVNKLQEVASGVWWPMEATVESEPRDPNSPYKRTVYRALKVVANDPNFNESIFTPAFPKGYRVDDKVSGKKYIVDSNLVPIAEPNG